MKKLLVSMLIGTFAMGAFCDAPVVRRSRGNSGQTATRTNNTARSAVSARSAVRTPADSAGGVVRSGRTTVARSATPTTSSMPTVVARAAKQNVIQSGTKVQTSTADKAVSSECRDKFFGCMDSFCMLENETGGRCICSNRNAELDKILAEIETIDQQSYKMATTGVARLEMGADADLIMEASQNAIDSLKQDKKKENTRTTLDLSLWDDTTDDEEYDIFSQYENLKNKKGDALQNSAIGICAEQMPECDAELTLLKMAYAQRVRSDCAAYENSLDAQKKASQNKLNLSKQALRQTAFDELQRANKYDLGQCTVKFKECMIETGECGEDFSKCATIAAMDSTNAVKSTSGSKVKRYKIQGSATTIEIYASTYDTLLAKKPLCEHVTKECTNVAGQVWETFLKEVAPQVKSAEIIAEDKVRQDCIGNISSCFQKACKDSMDPNDPDGSYDMCLSRPETMLNVCKIPLNACGIDTARATESTIWDFVVARLASIRVDACTDEIKSCLQSEDRCGEDYSQCVGLDTDTIVRMCPYDKLVGCQKVYGETDIRGDKVYEELANMVQGIFLGIDNAHAKQCQDAVNTATVKVCGDTASCNGIVLNDDLGARSLEYKICEYGMWDEGEETVFGINYDNCYNSVDAIPDTELGANGGEMKNFVSVIDGTIYWESVSFDENGKMGLDQYWDLVGIGGVSDNQKERVNSELVAVQAGLENAMSAIEADPTVTYCMTGRQVQGMDENIIGSGIDGARFPGLTRSLRTQMAMSALAQVRENYYKKYEELNARLNADYARMAERIAEIRGENAKDARREAARMACLGLADASVLAKSKEPPKSWVGTAIVATVAVAATVAVTVLTAGAGAALGSAAMGIKELGLSGELTRFIVSKIVGTAMKKAATNAVMWGVAAGVGAVAGGAAAIANASIKGNANGENVDTQTQLTASAQSNSWNYKETVTTNFDWENLVCQKCIVKQNCAKTKTPLFGKPFCKTWADKVETCSDTQF